MDADSETRNLPSDFYYPKTALQLPLRRHELKRDKFALTHGFGYNTQKRHNSWFLEDDVILSALGNHVIIYDITKGSAKYLPGTDLRGVGAIAVDPTRTFFAVAEKGNKPNILVYEYPSLKVHRILRGGTERSYSSVVFSAEGTKIASVGGAPDYNLTVWSWKNEKVVLRSKAFAQEVFNVKFSPTSEGRLTTSGMGHIRFWRMANTFTGLKLQGDIGKFGKVDLSDVDDFAELPDGKVLSGSESGNLLLWDGMFIKFEVRVNPEGGLAHNGKINAVHLDKVDHFFVTGGNDGYLRWWDFDTINEAELGDDEPFLVLEPEMEVKLPEAPEGTSPDVVIGVKAIARSPSRAYWVVQDTLGRLWRMDAEDQTFSPITDFHAGPVNAVATSPNRHYAASTGRDGTVRCLDYVSRKPLYTARFPVGGTAVAWAPLTVDPDGLSVAAGFEDGVVRILVQGASAWKRAAVFKPHNCSIVSIQYSKDGEKLATLGSDGSVFLFSCPSSAVGEYNPIGFVTLPSAGNSINWRDDSLALLVACQDQTIRCIAVPQEDPDTTHTFELHLPMSSYSLRMPEPPKPVKARKAKPEKKQETKGDEDSKDAEAATKANAEEESKRDGAGGKEEEEEEDEEEVKVDTSTGAIRAACFCPGSTDKVYVAVSNYGKDTLVEVHIDEALPAATSSQVKEIEPSALYTSTPDGLRALTCAAENRLLIASGLDGCVVIRPFKEISRYAVLRPHDAVGPALCAVASYDGNFILSCGSEGSVFVYRCHIDGLEEAAVEAKARGLDAKERDVVPAAVRRRVEKALSPAVTAEAEKKKEAAPDTEGEGAGEQPKAAEEGSGDAQEAAVEDAPAASAEAAAQGQAKGDQQQEEEEDAGNDLDPKQEIVSSLETGGAVLTVEEVAQAAEAGVSHVKPLVAEVAATPVPDTAGEGVTEADDITSKDAYSIQDAKLKTEEDERRRLAEIEKEKVRKVIRELEQEFAELRQQNAALPRVSQRLREPELVVDPELVRQWLSAGEEHAEEVKKELAWYEAKSKIALEKLRRKFLDDLAVEGFRVKALLSKRHVATFRTPFLSEALQESLREVHEALAAEEEAKALAEERERDKLASRGRAKAGVSHDYAFSSFGATGEEEHKSNFDQRREMRLKRKAALKALKDNRPAADADDPKDVEAIEEATKRMGDFKLKSSSEYEVPVEKQVDASKKRREMVLLEESVHSLRMRFNSRVLRLRSDKRQLLQAIQQNNARLAQINAQLGESEELWTPAEDPEEWPEQQRGSKAVDKTLTDSARNARPSAPSGTANGLKVRDPQVLRKDAAAAVGNYMWDLPQQASTWFGATHSPAQTLLPRHLASLSMIPAVAGAFVTTVGEKSLDEVADAAEHKKRLQLEKKQILEQQDAVIKTFDERINALSQERLKLHADLKQAAIRLLVLYQELQLLRDLAKRDDALNNRLEKCKAEAKTIEEHVKETKQMLGKKEEELKEAREKEEAVHKAFQGMVSADHAAFAALQKIFKRKIKRRKPQEGEEEDSEEDSDLDDFDSDDDMDDDEDDSCPPNCEQGLYEKVLELREDRLDAEEVVTGIVKAMEERKTAQERQLQRGKQIAKDLAATTVEIKAFQKEKQARLNELRVILPLRISQILIGRTPGDVSSDGDAGDASAEPLGAMPPTLDAAVVFPKTDLEKLHKRVDELKEETSQLRDDFKGLQKQQRVLTKEKQRIEKQIADQEAKSHDLQMLKFGQEVDIDSLDQSTASTGTQKIERQIREDDSKHTQEIAKMKSKLRDLKRQLLEVTQENTELVEGIAGSTSKQMRLEKELDQPRGDMYDLSGGADTAMQEAEERAKLIQLVKIQAEEMEALKAEIGLLRRKGALFYAPSPSV